MIKLNKIRFRKLAYNFGEKLKVREMDLLVYWLASITLNSPGRASTKIQTKSDETLPRVILQQRVWHMDYFEVKVTENQ